MRLEEKLSQLNDMKLNEVAIFEAQVINSLLDNREKVRVLKLIDARKQKVSKDTAFAVISEGVDFD